MLLEWKLVLSRCSYRYISIRVGTFTWYLRTVNTTSTPNSLTGIGSIFRTSLICPTNGSTDTRIRINQVLDNLLTNAIKFTKEGIVSISITKRKKGENHTDTIITSVKDTGTGIHPEILPSLFSKFGSRSDIGTGLGLFISKNILEAHGGKIWGENNTDGKGATFVFTLP